VTVHHDASAVPPPGAPWDTSIDLAPLAFVDLEMTGLDAAKDRIVEICVQRASGSETTATLHTLVRPEVLSGEVGNVHVHGITAEALRDAPTFAEISAQIREILDGAVLVAHGASWDVAFLEASMARVGQPMPLPFYLDTLNLSRRAFDFKKHSLDALRVQFALDKARAHRADSDVAALRAVWGKCVEQLAPKTPRDVWQVRVAERKVRDSIVVECTDAVTRAKPVLVHYRPRGKPQEVVEMVLVQVIAGLDPPRVIGYQLPGRGRRELRADRILRIEHVTPADS
jgi:DNA polymerase-3 subunit epsilon